MKLTQVGMMLFATTLSTAAMAQTPAKKTAPQTSARPAVRETPPPPPQDKKAKLTPEERAERQTMRMEKELELTPDQKNKVAVLNKGVAQKNQAIRDDQTITKEQKKERLRMNHEQRKGMLKEILTDSQYAKMEQKEEEKKAKKAEMKAKHAEMHKSEKGKKAEHQHEGEHEEDDDDL